MESLIDHSGPLLIGILLGLCREFGKELPVAKKKTKWTKSMNKELLELYLHRMPGAMMANYFDCSQRDLVRQIACLVLGKKKIKSDKRAPRYGEEWTWRDDQVLRREFQLGKSIDQIAETLGRDELGVAFRILAFFEPQIPAAIVQKYGLDENPDVLPSSSPLQGDDPRFVKVCSECRDVVPFCKCPIKHFYGDDAF